MTCGTSLRRDSNPKPCPQPALIQHYLKENTGYEGSIKESDKVCYVCYRSHLVILQQRNDSSTDKDLLQLIAILSKQIPTSIKSTDEWINAAMTRVVVAVGRDLLNGNVMLLPHVHNLFNLYASELSYHLREEIDTSKLVTLANILSNLKTNLQHHIAYCCKTRKHGTLMYRPNADLRPALAQALWRLWSKNITKECSSETDTSNSDDPQQYLNVLDDLNTRACSHITSYLSKHNKQNFEFVDLDIDKKIEGTDPKLWEGICLLPRSTSETGTNSCIHVTKSCHWKYEPQKTFINIQDYLSLARANHTEKSNVLYLDVMDAKSDSKDTLMSMLQNLHQQFISRQGRQHLVVEGDAKIYELLQSLKFEYGDELQWLIPFPGDWHLLMNYQSALMKPYFDAGLKSLAEASGYPVAAIRNCTQFKRTHFFILKSWKAMYRAMLSTFINISSKDQSKTESIVSPKNLREQAIKALNEVNERTPVEFRKRLNAKVADITSSIPPFYQQFKEFIQTTACRDETWRFWIQYVFVDAMAYVSLFFATRSGDWHLRMSSVKSMAAVFTAFDHPTYQKLISNHLSDLLSLPRSVLPIFEQGAFVVNTTGRSWHSVGIDEAHEMLINKQCKMSITKPSPDYINRIASYLTYRTKTFQQVKQQVFPETKKKSSEPQSVFSSKDCDKKSKQNVNAQLRAITASSLFETSEQQ